MADYKLVTAGDDIRLWDINGYSLVKQYNPHAGAVNSIAWSQDSILLSQIYVPHFLGCVSGFVILKFCWPAVLYFPPAMSIMN